MSSISAINEVLFQDPDFQVWINSVTSEGNETMEYEHIRDEIIAVGEDQRAAGLAPDYLAAFRLWKSENGITYDQLTAYPADTWARIHNDFDRHFLAVIWSTQRLLDCGSEIETEGGIATWDAALKMYCGRYGVTYDILRWIPIIHYRNAETIFRNYFKSETEV